MVLTVNNNPLTYANIFKHFDNRNKYKYKRKKKHIKCGTIILNSDKTKILLVQNNYLRTENNVELWGIPKGSRLENETYADCAIRETLEETGLHLKLTNNMIRVKIHNTYYFIYILEQMTNILVPVDKIEIHKVQWFDIKSINVEKINLETTLFIKRKLNIIKAL